jgi:hypothetical protein
MLRRQKPILLIALALAVVTTSVIAISATTAGSATGPTVIHLIGTEKNNQFLNRPLALRPARRRRLERRLRTLAR